MVEKEECKSAEQVQDRSALARNFVMCCLEEESSGARKIKYVATRLQLSYDEGGTKSSKLSCGSEDIFKRGVNSAFSANWIDKVNMT